MELHLDASIDKLDNLAMNVQFDKEKRMEHTKDKKHRNGLHICRLINIISTDRQDKSVFFWHDLIVYGTFWLCVSA